MGFNSGFKELIIDTENAVRYLDTKIPITFRYLVDRKIKHFIETNTRNTLHKRHQYKLKQTKTLPENVTQQNKSR